MSSTLLFLINLNRETKQLLLRKKEHNQNHELDYCLTIEIYTINFPSSFRVSELLQYLSENTVILLLTLITARMLVLS